LSCRSIRNAVDADNYSFWRRRFRSRFEKPVWDRSQAGVNLKYKQVYQHRRNALMFTASFTRAITQFKGREIKKAIKALEVLRDLIVGTFQTRRSTCDEPAGD
jgi:hypothetical protein